VDRPPANHWPQRHKEDNPLLLICLNRTFAVVAASNAAADQYGPAAERTGGNTGGPTIQHGKRLARASTAFMQNKQMHEGPHISKAKICLFAW
jgi:hypothetical protein